MFWAGFFLGITIELIGKYIWARKTEHRDGADKATAIRKAVSQHMDRLNQNDWR